MDFLFAGAEGLNFLKSKDQINSEMDNSQFFAVIINILICFKFSSINREIIFLHAKKIFFVNRGKSQKL